MGFYTLRSENHFNHARETLKIHFNQKWSVIELKVLSSSNGNNCHFLSERQNGPQILPCIVNILSFANNGPYDMVHIIWSISYGPYHMVHIIRMIEVKLAHSEKNSKIGRPK